MTISAVFSGYVLARILGAFGGRLYLLQTSLRFLPVFSVKNTETLISPKTYNLSFILTLTYNSCFSEIKPNKPDDVSGGQMRPLDNELAL